MPYRKTILVKGEIYHIFNRSVARQPIFLTNRDYQRALDVISFYNYTDPGLRYSHYNRLPQPQKQEFLVKLKDHSRLVNTLSLSLMPNHLHFLLQEVRDGGISRFMRNFQNSYAKYFNIRTNRSGSLFESMFKIVRIETDEQLIHVARYIHLNPVTAYILKSVEELMNYPWSSFSTYVGKGNMEIINKELILYYFASVEEFIKFTKDQVDYQRELDKIKHLALE